MNIEVFFSLIFIGTPKAHATFVMFKFPTIIYTQDKVKKKVDFMYGPEVFDRFHLRLFFYFLFSTACDLWSSYSISKQFFIVQIKSLKTFNSRKIGRFTVLIH